MPRHHPALLISFVFFIALAGTCTAQVIDDPENVTYMKADIMQSGRLTLQTTSHSALAEQLTLRLYVPQNSSRQQSGIKRVMGPDDYTIENDGYGNLQILLTWEKPPLDTKIEYIVETEVETETTRGMARPRA